MPPWKVSRKASLVNKTSVFGDMAGIVNRKRAGVSSFSRANTKNTIPSSAKEGFEYMASNNMLSINPVGSGGVHPVGPYLGNSSMGGGGKISIGDELSSSYGHYHTDKSGNKYYHEHEYDDIDHEHYDSDKDIIQQKNPIQLTSGAKHLYHDADMHIFAQAVEGMQIKIEKTFDRDKLHHSIKNNYAHYYIFEYRNYDKVAGVWGPWRTGDIMNSDGEQITVNIMINHDNVHLSGVHTITAIHHLKLEGHKYNLYHKHQVKSSGPYTTLKFNTFSAIAEDVNADVILTEPKYLHRFATTVDSSGGSVPAKKFGNFHSFSQDVSELGIQCTPFAINRTVITTDGSYGAIHNNEHYTELLNAIDGIHQANYYIETALDASNIVNRIDKQNEASGCVINSVNGGIEASGCSFIPKKVCADVFNTTDGSFACGHFAEVSANILQSEFENNNAKISYNGICPPGYSYPYTNNPAHSTQEFTDDVPYNFCCKSVLKPLKSCPTGSFIVCPGDASNCLPGRYNITKEASNYVKALDASAQAMLTDANTALEKVRNKMLYEVTPTFTHVDMSNIDANLVCNQSRGCGAHLSASGDSTNFWAFTDADLLANNFSKKKMQQYQIVTWEYLKNYQNSSADAQFFTSFILEKTEGDSNNTMINNTKKSQIHRYPPSYNI